MASFERNGTFTLSHGDNSLTVRFSQLSTSEPYSGTPNNDDDVIDFFHTLMGSVANGFPDDFHGTAPLPLDDNVAAPALPSPEAGTVAITGPTTGTVGTTVNLSRTLGGTRRGAITQSWSVSGTGASIVGSTISAIVVIRKTSASNAVVSITTTATGDGTTVASGTDTATDTHTIAFAAAPVVTRNNVTRYARGVGAPSAPASSVETPGAPWTFTTQPLPTATLNVFRLVWRRTYDGNVFRSAAIVGSITKVADATGTPPPPPPPTSEDGMTQFPTQSATEALPRSGLLSIKMIAVVFVDDYDRANPDQPYNLTDFYAGGDHVPVGTMNDPDLTNQDIIDKGITAPYAIPSSGDINISDFYGARKSNTKVTGVTVTSNPRPNQARFFELRVGWNHISDVPAGARNFRS